MEIKFLKAHTHDGKEYQAGDTLSVDDEIARWLLRNKIAVIHYPELTEEARSSHAEEAHPSVWHGGKKDKGGKR